jgi:hypothetical protein
VTLVRAFATLLAALGVLAAAVSAAADPEKARGVLEGRVTFRGEVLVDGDLEVAVGAVLTVEPGTVIRIAADDLLRAGFDKARVEIHVKGALLIAGTPEDPVRIGPEAGPTEKKPEPDEPPPGPGAKPSYDYPWHGIVFWPAADPATPREITSALIRFAFVGIQLPMGKGRVEGSAFLRCGIGVEVGTAWVEQNRHGMAGGVARPLVTGCRFAECGTGVYVQLQGAPMVERCVFAGCRLGVGNNRFTGWTYPLHEPGSTVDHCDFVGNETGVMGSSIVTSSVFARNETALGLSSFHTSTTTDTEQCAFRGNVFAANGAVFRGESDPGEALVVEDVGYDSTPEALDAALRGDGPALPDGLRLRPGSPARGRAAGGSDPGARAPVVPPPSERPWMTSRARFARPLLLEVTGESLDVPRLRPVAGALLAGRWWCRGEAAADGTFRLRDLFGGPQVPAAFAFRVDVAPGGPVTLEVNGDLLELEACWNGEPVRGFVAPRRFDTEGALATVPAKSGANLLVLRLVGRGVDPRVGVAISPPGSGRAEETAPPAARDAEVRWAKITRRRDRGDAPWLEVNVSTPLSWLPGGRVVLRDREGRELPAPGAAPIVESRHLLLYGPLPDSAAASAAAISLTAFRAPDATPLRFPPAPVN